MNPPVVLTVAANDPLGGAGLAADLATFSALGVHGMTAVTAVTVQRFESVDRVEWMTADLVGAQLDALIGAVPIAAMKSGLLGRPEIVAIVAERVAARRLPVPVVDPVMVDGQGRQIVDDETVRAYRELLIPGASVVTPNLAEARLLAAADADTEVEEMVGSLAALGATMVVVTGGRGTTAANDAIIGADGRLDWLRSARIDTRNVRGTGCTFSAAVAAALGRGRSPVEAVATAHEFVRRRLRDGADWDVAGPGAVGPVAHVMGQDHQR